MGKKYTRGNDFIADVSGSLLYKRFWEESAKLIDMFAKDGDDRGREGVVDCRILIHRLYEEAKSNDR